MVIEDLNPFIRYASTHLTYYPKKENSVCYDCRLFFILQGKGSMVANGQSHKVAPNLAVFFPPKTQYNFFFENNDDVIIYVLNFDLGNDFKSFSKSIGTATESLFDKNKVFSYELPSELSEPIIQQNGISILNYAKSCVELFLQKSAFYQCFASANLKLALLNLLNETNGKKKDYKLITEVQNYIKANYSDAELCNEEIAKQFGYHPYHVNRLIKMHTQKTLRDYLVDYRIYIAKVYLRTTTLNVTEVSEKTGFSSYSYFIKIFRERTGFTPLKYRKSNKNVGF